MTTSELNEERVTVSRAQYDALVANNEQLRAENVRLIDRCAKIAAAQPYYPDTKIGMRQQWVKDQIEATIRALAPLRAAGMEMGEKE